MEENFVSIAGQLQSKTAGQAPRRFTNLSCLPSS